MESEERRDLYPALKENRKLYPDQEKPALLTPSSRASFDYGVLRNCIIPVNKPIASLTFNLITDLRKAMGAVRYKIGHAGIVDIMGSGLVLLLCGYATRQLTIFANKEKEYIGRFRIGQETKTFDVLSPVQMTYPWKHISDGKIEQQTQDLIGRKLRLVQADYIPQITKKNVLCHLKRRSEQETHSRIMELSKFKVSRCSPESNEFEFQAICKSSLSVSCLIHKLGQKLRCGAHVLHSERIRVGNLTLSEHSWDPQELMECITQFRQTAYLKNYQLYDQVKNQYWRRLGPTSNRKRKQIRKRRAFQAKIKRQIKEGKRTPIMTALCY
eukprot:g9078.t1